MKKLLGIVVLGLLLSGKAYSEQIIISCKSAKYKYVNDGSNILVFSTNKKRDKGIWHRWPYSGVTEDNKHFLKSLLGVETIIDSYKVTTKSKKIVLLNGDIAKNSNMTIDFKKFTRKGSGTWKGKPYNINKKCKLESNTKSASQNESIASIDQNRPIEIADKKTILPTKIAKWDYACDKEDFKKYVATIEGCVALQHLGKIDKAKKKLVIFLHGDNRGKGDNKVKKRWGGFSKIIKDDKKNINFFYLARPGHKFENRKRSAGRYKNYEVAKKLDAQDFKKSWQSNKLISQAIYRLKEFYQPEQLVVIGFSGGAYDIGIISGKVPGLIDVGIMGGCYCYVSGKDFWVPGELIKKIDPKTKLILISGKEDESIIYAERYFNTAKKQGLNIKFHIVEGGHDTETFLGKQGTKIVKEVLISSINLNSDIPLDLIDKLKLLEDMFNSGTLTKEQFEKAKNKLLN